MSLTSLDILIEEYKTLRQESLNAINSRWSILTFGFSSMSLAIAASVTAWGNSNKIIPGLILIILVPLIAFFVLSIWFGEYKRMQRAGKFLALLEMRINHVMDDEIILSWENYLRIKGISDESNIRIEGLSDKSNKITFPYNFTVLILTLFSLCSIIIGGISISQNIPAIIENKIWLLVIALIVVHIFVYQSCSSKLQNLRQQRITPELFQAYKAILENEMFAVPTESE